MFFFYSTDVNQGYVTLYNEEHTHCKKVLRKSIGDILHITDGCGNIFFCKIDSFHKESTTCQIVETISHPIIQPNTSIAIAPLKNMARIEWFLEKATEIGITEIQIVMTQRSEKKSVKLERLEKIIISAMKQSLKAHLPQLHYFDSLKACLEYNINKYEHKFIGFCDEKQRYLNEVASPAKDTIVLIGPEGDFTQEEVDMAQNKGYETISLGQTRLRTETAALVALMTLRLNANNL